jgi:hypothetical protein
MIRVLLACASLSLGVAACADSSGTTERRPARANRAAPVVTSDDPSLPDGCRPGQVARTIEDFFRALNNGEQGASDHVAFESAAGGGWYSLTEGDPRDRARNFSTRDPSALRRYLAARHRRHERLRLRELVVGYSNGLAELEYRLSRRADDVRSWPDTASRVLGKGAVDCARRKIAVWSMATPAHPSPAHTPPLCPRPDAPTSGAVACARPKRT